MISGLFLGILFAQAPAPPAAPSDPLPGLLKASQLRFEELPEFYKVPFTLDVGRQQTVYIRKGPATYNSLRYYEAFSICYESDQAPSPEFLQKHYTSSFHVGGYVLEQPSDAQTKWRIRFRLELRANETPERFRLLVSVVAATGDQMAREMKAPEEKTPEVKK